MSRARFGSSTVGRTSFIDTPLQQDAYEKEPWPWRVRASFSPSPRPSPLGRIVARLLDNRTTLGVRMSSAVNQQNAASAQRPSEPPVTAFCCSLSPRERARVRGKSPWECQQTTNYGISPGDIFPARVKCAILPWHAVMAAVEGRGETVTTEKEDT